MVGSESEKERKVIRRKSVEYKSWRKMWKSVLLTSPLTRHVRLIFFTRHVRFVFFFGLIYLLLFLWLNLDIDHLDFDL